MTLKPLLSFLRSREQCQDTEQGLILSQRLKELLQSAALSPCSSPNQTDVANDFSESNSLHRNRECRDMKASAEPGRSPLDRC